MRFEFADKKLERIYTDRTYAGGYGIAIVRGFRKVMQAIRESEDERDLFNLHGLRFEKMMRNPPHEHSFKINDQFRLIVLLLGTAPDKYFRIMEIEDPH